RRPGEARVDGHAAGPPARAAAGNRVGPARGVEGGAPAVRQPPGSPAAGRGAAPDRNAGPRRTGAAGRAAAARVTASGTCTRGDGRPGTRPGRALALRPAA